MSGLGAGPRDRAASLPKENPRDEGRDTNRSCAHLNTREGNHIRALSLVRTHTCSHTHTCVHTHFHSHASSPLHTYSYVFFPQGL